jgi:arylsulfatase A-like enzyme
MPCIAVAADQPNVVILLADNVGYGDIGVYGAGEIRGMPTPRIDEIARDGLRLTQYLVEPACTPSRAALMIGRPFFLYVGFTYTHYPIHTAPEFVGKSRIDPYGDAIMELD